MTFTFLRALSSHASHAYRSVIFPDDSQVTYVFIVLAIILFIVMVAMISVICIKSGKKKLPPADVIPEVCLNACRRFQHVDEKFIEISTFFHCSHRQHHIKEKGYKDSDRYSNNSELKDPDRDYSEYSGTESTATRMAINILGNGHVGGVPLAGPVKIPNDQRYSGDYTDMHVATKIGLTNNGYISYNDYSRDYSPPNSMRTNSTSLKNHLIASSGHSPLINTPATINGSIDHYSLGRNRELRQDNGLPSIPMSTMPNGMMSKYYSVRRRECLDGRSRRHLTQTTSILDQSLLNNVDIRYSATYGNPFLKSSSNTPLPPPNGTQKPFTANPSVTPAPPPYNRSNNSNSSFSSSTTISNNGSLLGAGASIGLSYANPSSGASTAGISNTTNSLTQITSPSRQFILPANGDLKKGSLATHV